MILVLMGFLVGVLVVILALLASKKAHSPYHRDRQQLDVMATQLQHKYMARWNKPLERGKDAKDESQNRTN